MSQSNKNLHKANKAKNEPFILTRKVNGKEESYNIK